MITWLPAERTVPTTFEDVPVNGYFLHGRWLFRKIAAVYTRGNAEPVADGPRVAFGRLTPVVQVLQ